MKKYFANALYSILMVTVLCFTACQNEDPLELEVNEEHSFAANSTTAKLIMRTVSNDGSHDNIIDGSSCFDIIFPYVVAINGLEIPINSAEDFNTIEKLFDATENDDDALSVIFPITITTADYSEITVNDAESLHDEASQCIEGGADVDIECLDVIYPVTLFAYNPQAQETTTVSVKNDKDLSRFFNGLTETDLISIEYPVQFELYDDSKLSVNSNAELVSAIEQVKDICDEDDDNDYNDDDFTISHLEEWLVKCEMRMQWQFERDNIPNIAEYKNWAVWVESSENGKTFETFDRSGYAFINAYSITNSSEGVLLTIESDWLPELNRTWSVNKILENQIRLSDLNNVHILLHNNCDEKPLNDGVEVEMLTDKIVKNSWLIERQLFSNVEQFEKVGYELIFDREGSVMLRTNEMDEEGTWRFVYNNGYVSYLELNIGQDESFNFNYSLSDFGENRLIFDDHDAGNRLYLQETFLNTNPHNEILEIQEILKQDQWKVTNFEKLGFSDSDGLKEGVFVFENDNQFFVEGGLAMVTIGNQTNRWSVVENREHDLDLYLNSGSNRNGLGALTEVWTIFDYSNQRIELKTLNEDNELDTMVIEKY